MFRRRAPRGDLGRAMSSIWLASYLILWGVVVAEALIVLALLRGFTGLHQRLEAQREGRGVAQLSSGVILEDQEFISISGAAIRLSQLWQDGALLLLFVSVDCVPCRALLTWLGNSLRADGLPDWDVCILCAGHESKVRKLAAETGLPSEIRLVAVEHATLKWRYHVFATPTVGVVEGNGHVVDVVAGEVAPYLSILARRSEFRVPV
jgi:hypothetical protein